MCSWELLLGAPFASWLRLVPETLGIEAVPPVSLGLNELALNDESSTFFLWVFFLYPSCDAMVPLAGLVDMWEDDG